MRKFLLTLISLMAVASSGPAQPVTIDKVVAVVGREMILQSDIEARVQTMRFNKMTIDDNTQCMVLEELLLQKLLLAQARIDSLVVTSDEVDEQLNARLRETIAKLGGEKATEKFFNKPIYQIKKDWRDMMQEQLLTQRMQGQLMQDVPITPSEVEKAYKKMPKDSLPVIPPQYVLRQIVVLPPESDAKFDVRERLLTIRERINKGEKFSTLAVLYSEDYANAMRGGELGMAPAQNYEKPFADAASILKPGQVSPIVETEYGYHLIQMIEKESSDMYNVRHILLKPQYTSEERAAAFKRLDSIAGLVKRGDMTFEQAATKFSQDTKSSANGGLMVNEYSYSSRFEKDQLNPTDYSVLRDMKQGDVSIPFETRDRLQNIQYKIIQLVELIPSHTATLEDDYAIIQNIAKQQRRMVAFDKWIVQKQASTYIRIDDQYKNCKFERNGWVK